MKPSIKMGLLVGVIGMVLNVCVSAGVGLCGPGVSLVAGAVAGYLAAYQGKAATKGNGARDGATAGGISGLLITIGQVIGAISALAYVQFSGGKSIFGTIPPPSAAPTAQVVYYVVGALTGLCFGLVGVVLAALAGAGAGYLGTPDPVPAPPAPAAQQ